VIVDEIKCMTSGSMFPILIIFHYDISYPDLIFLLPFIYLHHEIIFTIIRALQKMQHISMCMLLFHLATLLAMHINYCRVE
jgi:hypothetical protein